LQASLQEIHQVVGDLGPKVDALIRSLHGTVNQLDEVAKSANGLVGGTTSQTGVNQALGEIAKAARSIRAFADYLDRHPESLLTGRSGR
jgi:paraquat-inducible protein B